MTRSKEERAAVQALEARRNKLVDDLRALERQIFTLEESYIEETHSVGNVIKGWDGFASASLPKGPVQGPKRVRVLPQDRIFSNSSLTSPQTHNLAEEDLY
jgi:chromatin modification-related protein EAF6